MGGSWARPCPSGGNGLLWGRHRPIHLHPSPPNRLPPAPFHSGTRSSTTVRYADVWGGSLRRCTLTRVSLSLRFAARAVHRRRAYDALFLDAGGTLLQLARPVEETYASIGRKYGVTATVGEVKQGFKRAFAAGWPEKIRYQGDGRPFWRIVVSEASGCSNNDYFEEVYEHYANGDAWHLPDGAYESLSNLRKVGVKLAVVSNFDTRLRKLLKDLKIADMFDAIIVSAEVGFEKPAPEIFRAALDRVGVEADKVVHVGDDEMADKKGANNVGINCRLWGSEIKTFAELEDLILGPDASND